MGFKVTTDNVGQQKKIILPDTSRIGGKGRLENLEN